MPRAISYIRFSSEKQRLGDSLRRQIAKTADYCQRHGLVLDESFRLADLGVSGYRGQNAATGKLGAFLEVLSQGKIERGTLLIVESLDRLGRQDIPEALSLFLRIVGAGVSIVTLDPERVHTPDTIATLGGIIEPLVIMARANEESATKSARILAKWKAKRQKVREGTGNLGKVCPWWIELKDGKYIEIPEHVEVVRQIFRMKNEGHGVPSIVKTLNKGSVKPRSAARWGSSSIEKIIRSRQCLGEFQPGVMVDTKEVDEGTSVKGYYPPVVDEAVFLQAQARGKRRGRLALNANIFQGLMYGKDGYAIYLTNNTQKYKDRKVEYRYYTSSGHLDGAKDANPDRFHADIFDKAFFRFVRNELDPRDFIKGESTVATDIVNVAGAIAGLEATIDATKVAIESAAPAQKPVALSFLMETDAKRQALLKELETLKAKQNTNDVETIGEIMTLSGMLEAKEDPDLRTRIRGRVNQLVKRIDVDTKVDPVRKRNNRTHYQLTVKVHFFDGYSRLFICDQDGELIRNPIKPIEPGTFLDDLATVNVVLKPDNTKTIEQRNETLNAILSGNIFRDYKVE
jgi:DNA invertase Pin-like site-specific DNA recombinase